VTAALAWAVPLGGEEREAPGPRSSRD
jgi:hypothetical protein